METRNETIHEQGKLKRKLGLGAALAVAVGTTVGSGIFSSLAEVAGASGSALMMINISMHLPMLFSSIINF